MKAMGFWETKNFKALRKEWAKKLEESGFEDIEDSKGRISTNSNQTNYVKTCQQSIEFYRLLDAYLSSSITVSTRDRKILVLYSEGVPVQGDNGIVAQVGLSRRTVHYVIAVHKSIILRRQ